MFNIIRPSLLIDESKARKNIKRMAEKAAKNNLIFRPHFKTHQSVQIGEWYREEGVTKITVSSVSMAEKFAAAGWNDITLAFPVNQLEIENINKLSAKIKLNLLVESVDVFNAIEAKLQTPVDFYIKIDTGYHRTGIDPLNLEMIDELINKIKVRHRFAGFLTHAGHTYKARSIEEISKINEIQIKHMTELRNYFSGEKDIICSVGDTPICSVIDDFKGVDEIRPGNFVFYDIMQEQIGSCSFNDIAVCMAVPVVAVHKERKEIVVYGGGVHLSKEYILYDAAAVYGLPVLINNEGWTEPLKESYVKSLSQEHGIVKLHDDYMDVIKPGDVIGILPVHSCLSADLMKEYLFI